MKKNNLGDIKLLLATEESPTVFWATVDRQGHPRVRPLTLMSTPEGFYIATSRKSRKALEMAHHHTVEMVTLFRSEQGTGYLRIAGQAKEVHAGEKKRAVEETHYPVKKYWTGVEDPDFAVYRIDPERVEYIRPGEDYALDLTEDFTEKVGR